MDITSSHSLELCKRFNIFWRKVSFIQHLKHNMGDLFLKLHFKSIRLALLRNLIPLALQDLHGSCCGTCNYDVVPIV